MSNKPTFKQNMADMKQKWFAIDPVKRRIILGSIITLIIIVMVMYVGQKRNIDRANKSQESVKVSDEVKTDSLVQPKVGETSMDEIRGMNQSEQERQRKEQEALLFNQQQIASEYKTGNQAVGQQVSDLSRQLASVTDEVKQLKLGNTDGGSNGMKLPPLQGIDSNVNSAFNQPQQQVAPTNEIANPIQQHVAPTNDVMPQESVAPRQVEDSNQIKIIRSSKTPDQIRVTGYRSDNITQNNVQNLTTQAKIFLSHGLPSGSILQGVLINGMDATAGRGKGTAVPALIRVKKNAILPNRYTQLVSECFVIVSGVGNLATERAEMRGEKMSCIFKDGTVVDSPLSAYVVGEDGKSGLRGRVVSKQGAIIARSMLAGVLGGLGKQFSPSSVPSLNLSGGDSQKYESPNPAEAAKIAAASGVGSSMERVANFYMDLAEQIVPVIEIDAGRSVTLILNNPFKNTNKDAKK